MPHLDEPVDVFSDATHLKLKASALRASKVDLDMLHAYKVRSEAFFMDLYFEEAIDSAAFAGLRKPLLSNEMKIGYFSDILKHGKNVQLGATDDEIRTTWGALVHTAQCRRRNGCLNLPPSSPIEAALTPSGLGTKISKHKHKSRWSVKPKFLYRKDFEKHMGNVGAAVASGNVRLLDAELQQASRCAAKAHVKKPCLVLDMKLIYFLDILERGGQVEVNASDETIFATWRHLDVVSQRNAQPLNHGWHERLACRVRSNLFSVASKK
jgi:hypothetical protein